MNWRWKKLQKSLKTKDIVLSKKEYLSNCEILKQNNKYTVKTPDGYLAYGDDPRGLDLMVFDSMTFTYDSIETCEIMLMVHIKKLYPKHHPIESIKIDISKF